MRDKLVYLLMACALLNGGLKAQNVEKKLIVPPKIWKVPEGNDFNDSTSKYNLYYHAESPNIAIFWSKKFAKNPSENKDSKTYFSVDSILQQCERFFDFYVDTLQFVQKGHSVSDSNKVLMIVFDEEDGTAYGGDSGDSLHIGVLWTPPARISRQPYGAVAHELGHVFQSFASANGGAGFHKAGVSMYEMTSQYMLWQVYPEWLKFENYHLKAFNGLTHLAFLHEENMYHSPFVLEYWSEKHGKDFVGKLWRAAKEGEDPVMVYKRMNQLSQTTFNDEMFDACRHFVNWNLPRIKDVAKPYAHLQRTPFDKHVDSWYQVDSAHSPQNYGYNTIPLNIKEGVGKIKLSFEGLLDAPGYRHVHVDKAGWKYGFVVELANGETIYSPTYSKNKATFSYKIPKCAKFLWLVVMGAPKEHWIHQVDGKSNNDEQWPYRFIIKGATIK